MKTNILGNKSTYKLEEDITIWYAIALPHSLLSPTPASIYKLVLYHFSNCSRCFLNITIIIGMKYTHKWWGWGGGFVSSEGRVLNEQG